MLLWFLIASRVLGKSLQFFRVVPQHKTPSCRRALATAPSRKRLSIKSRKRRLLLPQVSISCEARVRTTCLVGERCSSPIVVRTFFPPFLLPSGPFIPLWNRKAST